MDFICKYSGDEIIYVRNGLQSEMSSDSLIILVFYGLVWIISVSKYYIKENYQKSF